MYQLFRLDFNDHYRDQLDRLRQEAQSTIDDSLSNIHIKQEKNDS